jgi:hypothetical protein
MRPIKVFFFSSGWVCTQEINRLGEPCGWLNLEFVRGETDHSRQGTFLVAFLFS